ncbi:MAG TPA: NB-ARC domain-containing protein, partial [Methanothrix soehngenii]|nr:NB-ARC domain-containing protein [Methanothrix soehngenii]
MTERKGIDQRDQTVQGSQTNVGGNARDVFSGEFHGDVIVDSSGASSSFPIPRQIPLPPSDFTGREDELAELSCLFEGGSAILGLRGMGGVGKSALAFALAEKLKDRFPDGQIFVKMEGTSPQPISSSEAIAQVIRSYNPALSLPKSEAELANLYRSMLDGKRALLLLDNALDFDQVRPLLPPAKCSLIVTSRRKFNLPGMTLKDLDVLKLDKAVELLLSTAGGVHSEDGLEKKAAWEDLARLCGCLPVALRAAGSFLANSPDSSPEQYARDLQDEKRRLETIGKEGVGEDLNFKLSLSYRHLPEETAQVFRHLSVFPSDFDAQAEEEICEDEGHHHLSELLRWSLVEFQRSSPKAEGRYHLHDLVRLFAVSLQDRDKDLNLR